MTTIIEYQTEETTRTIDPRQSGEPSASQSPLALQYLTAPPSLCYPKRNSYPPTGWFHDGYGYKNSPLTLLYQLLHFFFFFINK